VHAKGMGVQKVRADDHRGRSRASPRICLGRPRLLLLLQHDGRESMRST
jgi:hypothetical protein